VLARTLDALSNQTDKDFEVVVVCDGPDPETERLAKTCDVEYRLEWIFAPAQRGAATARNLGANAARGDYLLFLDDDTVPVPCWLSIHREKQTAVGTRRLVVIGRVIDVFSRDPLNERERLLRKRRRDSLVDFEQTVAATGPTSVGSRSFKWRCFGLNCSIRRSVFFDVGGFDPALSYIDEDMELGSRLYESGVSTTYVPDAIVYHHDSKDLVAYLTGCWKAAGHIDLYRSAHKKQRNPQTKGVTGVTYASVGLLRSWKARLSWHWPNSARAMASVWGAMTEATGSSLFFRLWISAHSAEYWQSIRSEGQTLDSLRRLVGPAVTVVALHGIFEPENAEERKYHLSPVRFRSVLKLLSKKYQFATPDEAFSGRWPNPLILTFDDGYEDFYREVFPKVSPMGLKPLVFVVVDQIGGVNLWDQAYGVRPQRLLTLNQIREMHRHGVQFGSHSLTHPSLPQLSDNELRREVADSKSRLEDLLGSEVTSFAYPYGDVDARVRAAVAEAGYRFAFTVNPGRNLWDDRFALKRIEVSEQDSALSMGMKLRTGRNLMVEALALVSRHLPEIAKDPIRRIWRREKRRIDGRP
jgi:peptidoglycan/xylan/chitin deacetylase (PgdA/CDA1 family)/glycosyltransferase involved in cell wall biosynthesis